MAAVRKVIILGAAGRDFHNFNVRFRDDPGRRVVAFTAAQIPGIAGRSYPAALAGPLYPEGIPVHAETELAQLIEAHAVDEVVFSYSDVSHRHVMHLASIAVAAGASFVLPGPRDTMLAAPLPVVAVVAVRTGAGKSTLTRYLYSTLRRSGRRPVVVRHPMPYGRLDRGVERYQTDADLARAELTIEELEEYQPHIDNGAVVYAGVDYAAVLQRAAAEADVLLWDGGNNDLPFFTPDLLVTALDPVRPGQEDDYFPGEANVRAADVLAVTKVNVATPQQIDATVHAARRLNPQAPIVCIDFLESVDRPELVRNRAVLVIEDGPSVTHGGLREAAGARAARLYGGRPVDPRPYAAGSIAAAYRLHLGMGPVLPALGYSREQCDELRATIDRVPCDTVLLGTPIDLRRLLPIARPVARVRIEPRELSTPSLTDIVTRRLGGS